MSRGSRPEKRPSARRRPFALGIACALAIALPASADVLHLRSGRSIVTASWHLEGDTVFFESAAGVVGIPQDEVVRVEARVEPPKSLRAPSGISGTLSAPAAPATADAHATLREGANALQRRDYVTASARFSDVLRREPGWTEARVGYAVAEIALDRDGLALGAVLDGIARDPEESRFHEILGDLMNREERVEDALESWNAAFRLEPSDRLREKILKGERELAAGRYYKLSPSPHFNVRHDHDLDPELAEGLVDYLEDRYWHLGDALGHAPGQPIAVLLYPEREFRDVTRAPEWVGGVYDGKIRVPLGGLRRIDPRARALLVHELTHAIVHSKTRGTCPRWLHEGLAQHFEGRPLTRARLAEVRDRVAETTFAAWAASDVHYPSALAFVHYLESERDLGAIVRVLDLLGDGVEIGEAFERVYRLGPDRLFDRWREHLAGATR